MEEREPERDPRAAEPPAGHDEDAEPEQGPDRPAATEEPGPHGNPEVDEEGLANEQQG